jgi:hypothetical protein
MAALRSVDTEALRPLVPHPPGPDRPERWAALAEQVGKASDELAGELLLFADVPARAPGLVDDLEALRWSAAARVQAAYEKFLEARDLCDPALARCRILSGHAPPTRHHVVLVGVADLFRAAREALEQVPARVDALVAAPPSLADRFDALGAIIAGPWLEAGIDIPEDQVIFADNPRDQAAHALGALEGAATAPADTVIGVPDPEVTHHIGRIAARTATLRVREPVGRPVLTSAPARLLRAVAEYLDARSLSALAALLRHPDLERFLIPRLPGGHGPAYWLSALDDYACSSFRAELGDAASPADAPERHTRELFDATDRLLAPLTGRRPPPDWAPPLAALLRAIYDGQEARRLAPGMLVEACEAIATAIRELAETPRDADHPCAPSHAIRLILDSLADQSLPTRHDPGAVETVGWLDLPFDPASRVIVTGMNEEYLAGSPGNDPLLPDALRRTLGLSCADQRAARDAYLMSRLIAARPGAIFIAGRRSEAQDPLRPSRLLLAGPPHTVLPRLRRFFDDRTPAPVPRIHARIAAGPVSRFKRRPRIDAPVPERLGVTDFGAYLQSPYLFYLTRVLALHQCPEPAPELDARSYGALMHAVLRRFGGSAVRHADRAPPISEFLDAALAEEAAARFGPRPPGAVDLQLQILRMRLDSFARVQAGWRSQGWLIERVEWPARGARPTPFDVDGVPIFLSGRIDRIDRHQDGRIAILDYKSGNHVEAPDKTHRDRAGWKDLQLPLYRHIAAGPGLRADPAKAVLGYFALPCDPDAAGVLTAPWTPAELDSADEKARQIVRCIRAAQFDQPGKRAPGEWVFEVLAGLTFPDAPDEEAS